jgi:hypothetical protein
MPFNAGEGEFSFGHFYGSSVVAPICTVGYISDTHPTGVQLEAVRDAWDSNVMAVLNAGLSHVVTKSRMNEGGGDILDEVGTGTSPDGGISGNGCSPAVSYVVRKITPDPGRSGRGRVYLPGCSESEVALQGDITPDKAADLSLGLAAFQADAEAGFTGMTLAVLHRDLSAASVITSWVADLFVGTQRRRQPR